MGREHQPPSTDLHLLAWPHSSGAAGIPTPGTQLPFFGQSRVGSQEAPSLRLTGLHFEPMGVGSWQFGETGFGDSDMWECRNNMPPR